MAAAFLVILAWEGLMNLCEVFWWVLFAWQLLLMEKEVLCGGCELWPENDTAIKEEGRFWSMGKKAKAGHRGSLRCVEARQQSGSEGLGGEGLCFWDRTEGKRIGRNSVAESLAMFVIFRCVCQIVELMLQKDRREKRVGQWVVPEVNLRCLEVGKQSKCCGWYIRVRETYHVHLCEINHEFCRQRMSCVLRNWCTGWV